MIHRNGEEMRRKKEGRRKDGDTIQALAEEENIAIDHVNNAISYRKASENNNTAQQQQRPPPLTVDPMTPMRGSSSAVSPATTPVTPFSPLFRNPSLRESALIDVSLAMCRRVSVMVLVQENGNHEMQRQRCLFPAPGAAIARDLLVVNPSALGSLPNTKTIMETAQWVGASTEDWVRSYRFHQVVWETTPKSQANALTTLVQAVTNDLVSATSKIPSTTTNTEAAESTVQRLLIGLSHQGSAASRSRSATTGETLFGRAAARKHASVAQSMAVPRSMTDPADILQQYGVLGLIVHCILEQKSNDTIAIRCPVPICTVSILEVVGDTDHVYDLLVTKPYHSSRTVVHLSHGGRVVIGLSHVRLDSVRQLGQVLRRAYSAAHHPHRKSARGHMVATLTVVPDPSRPADSRVCRCVDIATPTATSTTNNTDSTSLTALGHILRSALLRQAGTYRPMAFRESVLTQVLQSSFTAPDSRVVVVSHVHSHPQQYASSLFTLRFLHQLVARPGPPVVQSPFGKQQQADDDSTDALQQQYTIPNDDPRWLQQLLSDPRQRLAKAVSRSPPRQQPRTGAPMAMHTTTTTEYANPLLEQEDDDPTPRMSNQRVMLLPEHQDTAEVTTMNPLAEDDDEDPLPGISEPVLMQHDEEAAVVVESDWMEHLQPEEEILPNPMNDPLYRYAAGKNDWDTLEQPEEDPLHDETRPSTDDVFDPPTDSVQGDDYLVDHFDLGHELASDLWPRDGSSPFGDEKALEALEDGYVPTDDVLPMNEWEDTASHEERGTNSRKTVSFADERGLGPLGSDNYLDLSETSGSMLVSEHSRFSFKQDCDRDSVDKDVVIREVAPQDPSGGTFSYEYADTKVDVDPRRDIVDQHASLTVENSPTSHTLDQSSPLDASPSAASVGRASSRRETMVASSQTTDQSTWDMRRSDHHETQHDEVRSSLKPGHGALDNSLRVDEEQQVENTRKKKSSLFSSLWNKTTESDSLNHHSLSNSSARPPVDDYESYDGPVRNGHNEDTGGPQFEDNLRQVSQPQAVSGSDYRSAPRTSRPPRASAAYSTSRDGGSRQGRVTSPTNEQQFDYDVPRSAFGTTAGRYNSAMLATNPEHQRSQEDPSQSYFDAFSEEQRARESPQPPEENVLPVNAVAEYPPQHDEDSRTQNGPRLPPREKHFFPISETNETSHLADYDDPLKESATIASSQEAPDSRSPSRPEENAFTTTAFTAHPLQQYEDGSIESGTRLLRREKHFFPITEANEPTFSVDDNDPFRSSSNASSRKQQGSPSRQCLEHSHEEASSLCSAEAYFQERPSITGVSLPEDNSALTTRNVGHPYQLEHGRSSEGEEFPQQSGDTTQTGQGSNHLRSSVADQTHQEHNQDGISDDYSQKHKQSSVRHISSQSDFLAETADPGDPTHRKHHDDPPHNRPNDDPETHSKEKFRLQDSISGAPVQDHLEMPLRACRSAMVDEFPYETINGPPQMSFDAYDMDIEASSKLQLERDLRQSTTDLTGFQTYDDDPLPVEAGAYSEKTRASSKPLPHEENFPVITSHITRRQQHGGYSDADPIPEEEHYLLGVPPPIEHAPLKTATINESSFLQEQERSGSTFQENGMAEQGILFVHEKDPSVLRNTAAPMHQVHSEQQSQTEKRSKEQSANTDHANRDYPHAKTDSPLLCSEFSGSVQAESDLPAIRDVFTTDHENNNDIVFNSIDVQPGAPLAVQPQVATNSKSVPIASSNESTQAQQDGPAPYLTEKSTLAHQDYNDDRVDGEQQRHLRHTPKIVLLPAENEMSPRNTTHFQSGASNPPWVSRQNDTAVSSESQFGYRKLHPTQDRQGKVSLLPSEQKYPAASNGVSYNDDSVKPYLDQSPVPSSGSSSPTLASRTDFDDFLGQFDSEDVSHMKNLLTNSDFCHREDGEQAHQDMRGSYNIPEKSIGSSEAIPAISDFEDITPGAKTPECFDHADLSTEQCPSGGVGRPLDKEDSAVNERRPSPESTGGERNDIADKRTLDQHRSSSNYDPPPLDSEALYSDERLQPFQEQISDEEDISALSSRESHGDEHQTHGGGGTLERILQESEASEELTAEQKSLESLLREADSRESTLENNGFDTVGNSDHFVSDSLACSEDKQFPRATATDYQHNSMREAGQQTPGSLESSRERDDPRDSMLPADWELATNGSSPKELGVPSAVENNCSGKLASSELEATNVIEWEQGSRSVDKIGLAACHSSFEGVYQRGSSTSVPSSNPVPTSKPLATKYDSSVSSKRNYPESTTMYSNGRAASPHPTEERESDTAYEFPPDSPASSSMHSTHYSNHDSDRKSQKHQGGETSARFRSDEPVSLSRFLPNIVSSRGHLDAGTQSDQQGLTLEAMANGTAGSHEAVIVGENGRNTEESNESGNKYMLRKEFPRGQSRIEKPHMLLEAHGETEGPRNISLEQEQVSTTSPQQNTTTTFELRNASKKHDSAGSQEIPFKDSISVSEPTTVLDVPRVPQIKRVTDSGDMLREARTLQVGQETTTSDCFETPSTQQIGVPPPEDRSRYPAAEDNHANTVVKPISKLGYQLPKAQQRSSADRPTNAATAAALIRLRSFESETQQRRPTEVTLEPNSMYDSPSRSIRSAAQYSIATEDSSALNEIDELEAAVDKVRQTNITVWQESLSSIENLRQLQASQLEELARTRAERNKANEELERLRAELQAQARAHDAAMKIRDREKRCLEDDIAEAKVVKEEVVKIAEDAIGMQAALEKKVDDLECEAQHLLNSRVPKKQYLSLEATIMGLKQQIEQLKEEVERLLLELQGRTGELDAANAKLIIQETELSEIREENRAARVQVSSLRGELEELFGIRDELQAAKDNLCRSQGESETLLLRERELNANLQQELDDTKHEASQVPQLESDMTRLRFELSEHRDILADSKETIARLGSEKAQLAQRLDDTTDELDRRVADVHELTACTKRLLEEREGDRVKMSGMETALSSFQSETRSRVEKVVQHRNEAAILLENALKENKALEETNQKLSDSYQQLQNEHEDAVSRLRTASRKADDANHNNRDHLRHRYDQDGGFLRTRRERDTLTSRPQRQKGEPPTATRPRQSVGFDDEAGSSRGEPSLLRSHWGSEQTNQSRDTTYTTTSSTRGEGERAVATAGALSPTEELAAKLALAARSRLETHIGYADFDEKLYKLEDEKDQDVLALKERIKALERRTTRNHRS